MIEVVHLSGLIQELQRIQKLHRGYDLQVVIQSRVSDPEDRRREKLVMNQVHTTGTVTVIRDDDGSLRVPINTQDEPEKERFTVLILY